MKIVKFQIQNFRSIDKLILDDLQNLNVFIGKNNSGKSTILSAIELFFKMINTGLVSEVYTRRDFHNGDSSQQIKFIGTVLLPETDFHKFIEQMKEEHPQILSTIDSLKNMPFINIYTSSLVNGTSVRSYIEKITLGFDQNQQNEKVLISFGNSVASELALRLAQVKNLVVKKGQLDEALKTFDSDDFRMMKERGGRPRMRSEIVSDLIQSASDFHEFRNTLREVIEKTDIEVAHLNNLETQNELTVFSGVTKTVPAHVQFLLGSLTKVKILRELERKEQIGKDDAARLLDLKVTRGGPERFSQLTQIVENLLGVRLEAFKSSEVNSNAEIDIDNFLVDMNGAGIRESLRLILDLEFNKPNIVLLEEPEVHLHFGLEKKIFRYLAQLAGGIQIFLTTHSTGFVDTSGTNNVFLVKKETATKATRLTNNEIADILNELDINVSSLLLAKLLVFVEGPTDEYIARSYFDIKHPEISYADIGFIRMKGIGNYKYYANAYALEVFAQRGLKTFFIVDLDNNTQETVKKLVEQHPQYSKIEVLPRRCIENFFLDANILIEFLKKKITISGIHIDLPSVEDIEKQISDIVDSLYFETIRLFFSWKYLRPIYPISLEKNKNQATSIDSVIEWVNEKIGLIEENNNNLQENFSKEYVNDLNELEERWKREKTVMVPGDKVLDILCSSYGLRYNKTQIDSDLLCEAMSNGKWPLELSQVFEKIVTAVIETGNSIFE